MLDSLRDYSNPSALGSKFRKKRFKHIESLVSKILKIKDECRILDIGGAAGYWNLMEPRLLKKCSVTVINLEKSRGPDPQKNIPPNGSFEFAYGDGCDLNHVADNQYDIAHSNSVIEHVGKLSDMQRFVKELTRVGDCFYLQTPNFWFPIEPHYGVPFIHWLPIVVRAKLMCKWNIGFHKKFLSLLSAYNYADSINLIDQNTLKNLLLEADFKKEIDFKKEKILFFTKSLISISPLDEFEKGV
jgi:2-polyprenyl-3-methyl-5-hydroxy-6-metoxy-1,4-benzoquinol methylase